MATAKCNLPTRLTPRIDVLNLPVRASFSSGYAISYVYYAYGQPHGDASNPEENRRKFSGKEYATEYGLDEYNFKARRMALNEALSRLE